MRINLTGDQGMSNRGMPAELIQKMIEHELCKTRKASEQMVELMRDVLKELKEIKAAIQENNQSVKDGITKADEALAEARLVRDEMASTRAHIADAKAAVEADTMSRRGGN